MSNSPLAESQGSGYVIVNYARGLRAKGHQLDLAGPESLEAFPFLKKAKSHRIALGMLVWSVRQLLRKGYDVLEFYGSEAWLAVSLLSLLPRRRFVMIAHSNGLETHCHDVTLEHLGTTSLDGRPPKWYHRLFNPPIARAFRKVDGIVTVSDFDREYAIARRYQPARRVVAIENSLPDEYLALNIDFDRPQVIGFCGSWIPRKGIDTLQTDATEILRAFPGCRLKLIGVGTEFRSESHFAAGVRDRVEAIPFVSDKSQLRNLYQSLAVLVMPSIYESFGLVAAEAMACGCALVATKTGFAASLRHREEAMLMPAPGAPHLYDAVRELLLDNDLRLRIARAGYARVQALRWPEAIGTLETTYLRWLGEAAISPP